MKPWEEYQQSSQPEGVRKKPWEEYQEQSGGGLLDSVVDAAVEVGQAIDSVTGAPTRKAIGALQEGGGFLDALSSFGSQFGEDPTQAPTGREIVERAGVPRTALSDIFPGLFSETGEGLPLQKGGPLDFTASGVTGFGVDVLADPTNVIPVAATAKLASQGASAAAKGTARIAGEAGMAAGRAAKRASSTVAPKATEAASGLVEGVGHIVQNFVRDLKPPLRPQYAQDVELAVRHGIDPELLSSAVKYGPDSFVSKAERARAQSPTGTERLARHQEGLNQVRRAADDEIRRIAGGAEPLDPQAAGELLRQGYNNAVEKFFNQIDVNYDTITQMFPGAQIGAKSAAAANSKLEGIRRKAIALAERGPTPDTRAQGRILLEDLDVIRRTLNEGSYKQVLEELRLLGENAFKHNSGVIKPITEHRRGAYFALRDALTDTVEELGNKEIADTLRSNNQAISDFLKKTSEVRDLLTDGTVAGERVFRQLIESGDSRKIQVLKAILQDQPEVLGRLKASYLENLKHLDKDEGFSFARLHNALRNNDKTSRVVNNLFDPGELDEFTSLIKLGDDFGPPILNPSGTFVSQQYAGIWETIQKQAANEGFINVVKALGDDPKAIETMVKSRLAGEAVPTAMPPSASASAGATPVRSVTQGARMSRREMAVRALRAMSVEAGRTKNVPISAEMEQDIKEEIARNPRIPNVEKARQIDHLNRHGEILDVEPLFASPPVTPPSAPESRKPTPPPVRPEDISDFMKYRRREPY